MRRDTRWNVAAVIAIALVIIGGIVVYRTQTFIDWPKTFAGANDVAQMFALVIGGVWALNRFIATRASRTFLELSASAKVVGGTDENLLVQIVIRLKNIGTSRIDARRGSPGTLLYDDTWDRCQHAGTLKIRAVPSGQAPALFDWYGLQPFNATLTLASLRNSPEQAVAIVGTLEQINYLADFQNPENGFTNTDFWLEPGEVYELTVPLWLPSGNYAVKTYFLGSETHHLEEEYWSHTALCRLEALPAGRSQSS